MNQSAHPKSARLTQPLPLPMKEGVMNGAVNAHTNGSSKIWQHRQPKHTKKKKRKKAGVVPRGAAALVAAIAGWQCHAFYCMYLHESTTFGGIGTMGGGPHQLNRLRSVWRRPGGSSRTVGGSAGGSLGSSLGGGGADREEVLAAAYSSMMKGYEYDDDEGTFSSGIDRVPPPAYFSSLLSLDSYLDSGELIEPPPPYGFVMRDLARRLLSGRMFRGSVFVHSHDAERAIEEGRRRYEHGGSGGSSSVYAGGGGNGTIAAAARGGDEPFSVGARLLLHAAKEGHRVYGTSRGGADDWWRDRRDDFDFVSFGGSGGGGGTRKRRRKDCNLLLAVFDPGPDGSPPSLDPSTSRTFLAESEPTYVLVGLNSYTNCTTPGQTSGAHASAMALIQAGYRVQLLSASHFYPDPENGGAWRPNSVTNGQGARSVMNFVRKSAITSREAAWERMEQSHNRRGESEAARTKRRDRFLKALPPGRVTAYLFATKRIDLAIPTQRAWLNMSKFGNKRTPGIINVEKEGGVPYMNCPHRHRRVQMEFRSPAEAPTASVIDSVKIYCDGEDVTAAVKADGRPNVNFWHSGDGDDARTAEAACVRLNCDNYLPEKKKQQRPPTMVACRSRSLPAEPPPQQPKQPTEEPDAAAGRPNVLLIVLRSMSRGHFRRFLSRTAEVLGQLGFAEFERHTAVDGDAESNLEALLLGGGGNDSFSHSNVGNGLLDRLRDAGYRTVDAEDACKSRTPAAEDVRLWNATDPQGIHRRGGDALRRMLCFDFDYPACVGGDMAARHLTNYAEEFIKGSSGSAVGSDGPWAAVLRFVEGDEDTMALSGILDPIVGRFLHWLSEDRRVWERTVVMVTSDHGIHYGSYLQSPAGRREYYEPLLFVRFPERPSAPDQRKALATNAAGQLITTPWDVYETIVRTATGRKGSSPGMSLLEELPTERSSCRETKGVPARYCDLSDEFRRQALTIGGNAESSSSSSVCEVVPYAPPSLLSFYADIPKDDRPRWPVCKDANIPYIDPSLDAKLKNRTCQCATSHSRWRQCTEAPRVGSKVTKKNEPSQQTFFAMVDCPDEVLRYDARIPRKKAIVDRAVEARVSSKQKPSAAAADKSPASRKPPNILFIEIDSVSMPFADRHFPKTRELLARHQIRREGDGYACKSGICSAFFSNFGIVGPNSVANQAAALGGCVVSPLGRDCKRELVGDNEVCPDPSYREFGLKFLKSGGTKKSVWCPVQHEQNANDASTWLFEVATNSGYVTFFGEEFCYPDSPWVIQSLIFEDKPDFSVHQAFCRLAEREVSKDRDAVCDETDPECKHLYMVDLQGSPLQPKPCLDGMAGKPKQELALELISSMWETYPDLPKLAYLNAIAAHDYAIDWARMTLGAEEYDDSIAKFLKSMLSRADANDTVIVLRSDHGLQGGPSIIDYSTQIEHRHPWTEIIVPDNHPGVSLDSLASNQKRLATGFDLYWTLRSLISPEIREARESVPSLPPVPEWAYDLLTSELPAVRTCRQAKIPPNHCPCEFQRPDPAPRYGVCNLFEEGLDQFCPDWKEVRERRFEPLKLIYAI